MKRIKVNLGSDSHIIWVGSGLSSKITQGLKQLKLEGNLLVVSQQPVLNKHRAYITKAIRKANLKPVFHILPNGEAAKSEKELFRIYDSMLKAKLDRSSYVLALGGGTVGDVAGFAASTFKRGLGYIQVPTTLLAQVDSAIGGKTAINLKAGKNLVGSFYQPNVIFSDIKLLKTLPKQVISDSLAEVIKYGMIHGGRFFGWLEKNIVKAKNGNMQILEKIVVESSKIKVFVVESDVNEAKGYRDILNYGHTFGHALEAALGYKRITHGRAVALGMIAASELAYRLGFISRNIVDRQFHLIESAGLPTSLKGLRLDPKRITSYLKVDKKVRKGQIKFILPQGIGKLVSLKGISPSLVEEILKSII